MSVERSELNVGRSAPRGAVFLSYASQDVEAAKRIADALRASGVEVWFDQSELRGGDSWDAKLRRQIKECALFVPVITPNTNARAEGYFRLEWKLAVDRSHLMADDAPFLFPIVVGDVADATARVPDKFRDVQWTRLRLDETPAELGQRVAKLLSGDVGRGLRTPPSGKAGFGNPALQRTRWQWWMIFPVIGTIMGLMFAAMPLWKATRRAEPKPAAVASPDARPQAPDPKLSEARQLTARARATSLDKYDSSAEDFAAAENLVKKALELDPNDAEIWAFSSLLNFSFGSRGFDHAPARVAAARSQAERALSLDPDSPEAQFALARWQRDNEEPAVAEASFKKILVREPNHIGALSGLAWIYDQTDRVDESAALSERIATLPGSNPALSRYTEFLLFFHRARFEEADRCIRQSIATQPSANSLAGLANLLLTWKGDVDGAAKVLASMPTSARSLPRTIWMTALVQLCQRAPAETLSTLDRFSGDYIQDNFFAGPKTYWVGRAHALAGRKEAARLAWETGLEVVNARLKNAAQNRDLHLMRGELLALLGSTDEALREARTVEELARGGRDRWWFGSPLLIYAALGRADDALPLLEKLRVTAPVEQSVGWPLTPALLRLDPLWDKLRGDPRFEALLKEPAAREAKTAAAPLREGPKDPELKRALQLIDSPEAIASDVVLAEDLVKGVLAAHPTDAAATLMMGRVQVYYLVRGFDRSEDRFASAKRFAERALALVPDDPDAMCVMATYLYRRAVELPRAAKLLRAAIALRPTEPLYYRMLDNVLSITPNTSDADIIAYAKVTAERFPQDPLVQYELARHYRDAGMLEEAEHYMDVAIQLGPVANAIIARARMKLFVNGDPAGMKALLDRLPERYQSTDRAVFSQFAYALVTNRPQLGLDALQAMPEPWMIDFDYTGPNALLAGELLLQQGKPELARLRFTEALAELGRHKADFSRNFSTTWLEPWLLMRLGRLDEARSRNAIFFPELSRPFRLNLGTNWWFNPVTQNLLLGEHAKALELMREVARFPQGRNILRNALRLDPRMAPFRDDPEIKAILAEPEVKQ